MDLQPSTTASKYVRIDADLLVLGRGAPLKDAICIFQSPGFPTLVSGHLSQMSIHLSQQSRFPPGLWDAHNHYYGTQRVSIDAFYVNPPALAGAGTAHDLAAALNAGFTSVRELGG
ncbi:MAG: hypothetical protein Q9175_007249 [Cornicularia normoerica]